MWQSTNFHSMHKYRAVLIFSGLVLICWIPFSCGSDPSSPDSFERFSDRYTAMEGDFHVHASGASNDTGGDSWPSEIAESARASGFDFIVLMDHSNSTGSDPDTTFEDPALFNMGPEFPYWDSAALLSDPDFLMIDGCELSPRQTEVNFLQPTGHIGCLPADLSTFDPNISFEDRPMGSVDGDGTVQQVLDAGGIPLLFHPYAVAPWIRYDWSSYSYAGMEVWNGTGGWDEFDEAARKAWLCDLLLGRQVFPIGGSDNHRVNIPVPGSGSDPALAYPSTIVWSDGQDWPSVVMGLDRGLITIREGSSELQLSAHDEDGRIVTEGGDWVFWEAMADPLAENPVLTISRCISCEDPRPSPVASPELGEEIIVEINLTPGEKQNGFFEALEGGIYHAILRTADGHYGALSGAVRP